MNPYMFPWMMIPPLPTNCDKPPTIYTILESIVNYGKDDKTKIKDLAREGRSTIFNFNYPLSQAVSKEDFECMILNHFLMRRINFDTVTAFRISLNAKLNEIMPKYNKLFDALVNWEILDDVDTIEKSGQVLDTNTQAKNSTGSDTSTQSSTDTNTGTTTSDRRNSELPQSELSNLRDGSYVSDYNYDTNNINATTTGSVNNTTNRTAAENNTENKKNDYYEKITQDKSNVGNKLQAYLDFQNDMQSIYTLIFKDLSDLFYGLV